MSFKFVKCLKLFRKSNYVLNYRKFCNEARQINSFRGALLYPERENLKIATLVNNDRIEKGLVNISYFLSFSID